MASQSTVITNLAVSSVSPVSSTAGPAEALWNAVFNQHLNRLQSFDKSFNSLPQAKAGYDRAMQTIQQISKEARRKFIPRCLLRLRFSLDHLVSFSAAFSAMSQSQSNPFALIWGCIEVVLKTAIHYVSTFETIADMLEQLTSTVSRMNRYLNLLPQKPILQKCVSSVLEEHVDFYVSAIIFYKRLSWYTVVKFVWKSVDEQFAQSKAKIQGLVSMFEHEMRVTIDEITVHGLQDIGTKLLPTATGPAPHKTIFKVDFCRNSFFIGRDKELANLHFTFRNAMQGGDRCVCTVHSMGGVGKTQLASEFAYRYRRDFEAIFWLPAEHGPRLAQRFGDIARAVIPANQKAIPLTDVAIAVQTAKNWLETTDSPWLLIYDNVEDWETIKSYWPLGNVGAILITTQNSDLVQVSGGAEIALAPFEPNDGAALLFQHLRLDKDGSDQRAFEIAKDISANLGGLAVAISHCAGYIEKSQSTLDEFRELYKNRALSSQVWSEDCSTWTYQYHNTLKTTWDIALAELPPSSRALINVLAMLDADAASEDMILQIQDAMNPGLAHDSILSLRRRCLVRREVVAGCGSWSIHRALQQSLLHRLDTDAGARQLAFDTALKIVRLSFPRHSSIQAPSNDNWDASEAFLAHVMHLQDVYKNSQSGIVAPREFAELLSDLGNYMWERGFYCPGIDTLKLAKCVFESLREQYLMEQSKAVSLLAGIYLELGISGRKIGLDYTLESRDLRGRYAQICASSGAELNQDDIVLIGNSWTDVACCMMEYGCYERVEVALKNSLKIKQDRGIPEDQAVFNYAENYKNLAIAKTAQGKHDEAVSLSAKAVRMIEGEMSSISAATQSFRLHLAYSLYQANKLLEALKEHDEIRKSRVSIFGEYGVHTLNSYYACSVVHHALGNLPKAEELLLHCLSSKINQNWTLEYLARVKFRLAMVWDAAGKPAEDIQRLKNEALLIQRQYTSHFLPFKILPGPEPSEMVIYDHMIPTEGGRSTTGQLKTDLSSMGPIGELLDE